MFCFFEAAFDMAVKLMLAPLRVLKPKGLEGSPRLDCGGLESGRRRGEGGREESGEDRLDMGVGLPLNVGDGEVDLDKEEEGEEDMVL